MDTEHSGESFCDSQKSFNKCIHRRAVEVALIDYIAIRCRFHLKQSLGRQTCRAWEVPLGCVYTFLSRCIIHVTALCLFLQVTWVLWPPSLTPRWRREIADFCQERSCKRQVTVYTILCTCTNVWIYRLSHTTVTGLLLASDCAATLWGSYSRWCLIEEIHVHIYMYVTFW